MNRVRPFVLGNFILQSAIAAKRGICLGRVEAAISVTRTRMSAAARLVPPAVFSVESWALLCVACFL